MYTLVGLLSLVASAAFVLAFAHGRRRHRATLFGGRRDRLVAPWSGIPRPARHGLAPTRASPSPFPTAVNVRLGRDGAVLAGAIALASGAPWSDPPSALVLAALLAPAALLARVRSDTVRLLALAAAAGVTLAWLASQLEPAWSPRSLAVLYGPVALAAAAAPARRPWAAATVVAAAALIVVPLPAKSNARTVAVSAGIGLRPEDLVISIQPEQVPVLQRYLPTGVRYLTPMGPPDDPRVMDWRDALRRLEAARPPRVTLAPGRRIVLVTPVGLRSRAPWARAVRRSTRAWRAALRAQPRVRRVGATSRPTPGRFRSAVRAEIYAVARRGAAWSAAPRIAFPSVDPSRCVPLPVLHRPSKTKEAVRAYGP